MTVLKSGVVAINALRSSANSFHDTEQEIGRGLALSVSIRLALLVLRT